jgi:hypothetical protein
MSYSKSYLLQNAIYLMIQHVLMFFSIASVYVLHLAACMTKIPNSFPVLL